MGLLSQLNIQVPGWATRPQNSMVGEVPKEGGSDGPQGFFLGLPSELPVSGILPGALPELQLALTNSFRQRFQIARNGLGSLNGQKWFGLRGLAYEQLKPSGYTWKLDT